MSSPFILGGKFKLNEESWRLQALCRGKDPNMWFGTHVGQEDPDVDRTDGKVRKDGRTTYKGKEPLLLAQGRLICMECPVWRECADYALRSFTKEGIWGGMNERQRREWNRRGRPHTTPKAERIGRTMAG